MREYHAYLLQGRQLYNGIMCRKQRVKAWEFARWCPEPIIDMLAGPVDKTWGMKITRGITCVIEWYED
jgi:hypothetical protein